MTIPKVLKHLVFEVPNFVNLNFCSQMIDRAKDHGFELATITSEVGEAVAPDIRNNDRVIFDDISLAKELWLQVSPLFSEPFKGYIAVGLNERFRIYKYVPGQFFDWHQDGEYSAKDGSVSKFTMMIYLNDVAEGGGTSFADVFSPHTFSDFTIEPETGKALFFNHPLSHRGDPVITGAKFVIRTDVMFKINTQ